MATKRTTSKKKGAMKGCGVKNGCKSKAGGLTAKGRKRINAKTGSNLKAPVPAKKVKPGSKAAKLVARVSALALVAGRVSVVVLHGGAGRC